MGASTTLSRETLFMGSTDILWMRRLCFLLRTVKLRMDDMFDELIQKYFVGAVEASPSRVIRRVLGKIPI